MFFVTSQRDDSQNFSTSFQDPAIFSLASGQKKYRRITLFCEQMLLRTCIHFTHHLKFKVETAKVINYNRDGRRYSCSRSSSGPNDHPEVEMSGCCSVQLITYLRTGRQAETGPPSLEFLLLHINSLLKHCSHEITAEPFSREESQQEMLYLK